MVQVAMIEGHIGDVFGLIFKLNAGSEEEQAKTKDNLFAKLACLEKRIGDKKFIMDYVTILDFYLFFNLVP